MDGLLGEERRKTGWMRAEAAGDPGPWRQQAILGRGCWDADALRDIVRDYVLERLADPEAVLVLDETGFLQQGKASCGVGRQYTGSAGKITNCQIGVFASYVSRHGHAFIDRALYLPKAWTDDRDRLAAAHVPENIRFATKPALALTMIERAIASNVPFSWVAADSVYGVGDIEMALKREGASRGQEVGQALYDQTAFDGILYMSRITNRQCVAVYDRAVSSKLEADSPVLDLLRLANLRAALDALHISLIEHP